MKYIYGNLLKETDRFDVIIQGCNCFHTFGAGLALQIKHEFPSAYNADLKTNYGDKNKLGHYSGVKLSKLHNNLIIVNAYTQFHFGEKRSASYDAISDVFELLATKCKGKRVGYPMIGAGLAGGDWNIIAQIIDVHMKGLDHTLVIYR